MLGTLYAHVNDSGRFLLVRRDEEFPYSGFDRRKWRVIAVGVEPITYAVAHELEARGFCAYAAPDPDAA